MRELKYRVWDTVIKKHVDLSTITITGDGELTAVTTPELMDPVLNQDRYILEQYTGVKDKNGKEIYEGDILGGVWESCYIAWCDRCKQFQVFTCYGCMACSGDVHWYEIVEDDGKLEVIGNIHENPELLREEEE